MTHLTFDVRAMERRIATAPKPVAELRNVALPAVRKAQHARIRFVALVLGVASLAFAATLLPFVLH